MSSGYLEGAPLKWLFGGVTVEGNTASDLKGWCFYVPAVLLVAEDRFGASSWLEFWIADLSLEAIDLRWPVLDDLARAASAASPTTATLASWVADVAGQGGLEAVEYGWEIWTGEELASERRAETGRTWPVGDEVSEWVNPHWPMLRHNRVQRFVDSFVDALHQRGERLNL